MKKLLFLFILGVVMIEGAYGKSWTDVFSSSSTKEAAQTVANAITITTKKLEGTWKYIKPKAKLTGDSSVKNATGSIVGSLVESKLEEVCQNVGITEGTFSVIFQSDSICKISILGDEFSGKYSFNSKEKTMKLIFGPEGNFLGFDTKVFVEMVGDDLQLLFEANKFLELVKTVASISNSSSMKTISIIAENYDGLQVGFLLKKQ